MKTSDSKYSKCLYFAANALARKIEKLALISWKTADLSPSHAYLLMMVIEDPGVQPCYLSDHLQLTPSTITRLIEKLEEKKLLVRTTAGKMTNIYPTPTGKKLLPKLHECRDTFVNSYCDILGKEESKRIVASIMKLADKLEI